MRVLVALACVGLVAGCANRSTTYAPDGRVAYALQCGGIYSSWAVCYSQAGQKCAAKGYDILQRSAPPALSTASTSEDERSLLIACKA